ncbi:trypsin domain-containing protein [Phthorimaea operculella]|nr:trypsin domain-containing protein [Phthorimaea operculella]
MVGFKLGLIFILSIAGCLAVPLTKDASRIVGGNVAANGSHPHMAALAHGSLWERTVICGGSILTQRAVLTAAHCIDSLFDWGTLSRLAGVIVGTNVWESKEGTYHEVVRNVTHPDWDRRVNNNNDIGMVFTRTNIMYSDRVQPVRLSWDFVGADVAVRAAGWGDTSYGGKETGVLLELNLRTIDENKCVQQMAEASINHNIRLPPVDPEVQICGNHPHSDGYGMCHGDSGGPLIRAENGMQVGVVSWGVPCGRDAPDVFVRVSAYRDWILRHVQ